MIQNMSRVERKSMKLDLHISVICLLYFMSFFNLFFIKVSY